MKILGVDPGLKATGYGLIEFRNNAIKLVETGTIKPKERVQLPVRVNSVYKHLDEILIESKPDVMVLEKLYAHYKHPLTATRMGHVRGVICLLCAQRKVRLAEYGVKRIRKAVVGNGNATKFQTQSVVAHILSIDGKKLTLDASDALALAIGFAYIHSRDL